MTDMYDQDDHFDDEPEPYFFEPESEPVVWADAETRRPSGCWLVIAIVLILALLASSLSGVIWLLTSRAESGNRMTVTAVPRTPTTVLPTAAPITQTEEMTATATSSALSADMSLPTSPGNPALISRIVYIDDEGQIVTIAADGSAPRRLTNGAAIFQFPTWAPDGSQIAAIGSNNLGGAVFVLADTDQNQEPLSLYLSRRAAPFYLYWSPDSQTVSFLASDNQGMALYLAAADGAAESRKRTTGGPLYWQWTADSQQLLIHSGFAGAGARLELLEAAGEKDGSQIANPGYFQAPGISGDGRLLAYAEETGALSSRVVVNNLQDGASQTQSHEGGSILSLSPDANWLAYISPDKPGETEFIGPLRLMNTITGEIRLLSQNDVAAFFWSPDGRYLAAFLPNLPGGDINVALPGKTSAKTASQTRLPTLNLVIFDVASGNGRQLLTFIPTLTFISQLLPFFDQYALSHRLWSPASDALVLPMLEDGRSIIYTVPIHGGGKRFLAEGSMAFWSQQ
ncbi:MAG: PD40 domain-containing protein [Anaerolineae bacterium]|nr:PD40 domain-containing protein [Anaerolineae bacterium]